jgi:iron complex outermembrane receptor protein
MFWHNSILFVGLMFLTNAVFAQCTLQLSGHINDAETKLHLQEAQVTIVELKKSVFSNSDGFFVFNDLCPGRYTLEISHADCKSLLRHLHLRKNIEVDWDLSHELTELKEVVVIGNQKLKDRLPANQLTGRNLESTRGLSLTESLTRITGVSQLQTGSTVFKPIINGLHSNRVLIYNNGVRLESQQWGGDHAPEVDPFIANRLTVIKGVAALRYGGDAIGGIVFIEPRQLRRDPGSNAEVHTAFFSNNRMGVVSAMFEGNIQKYPSFSWRAQGTFKRGGLARTPEYLLANSSMQEANLSLTGGWRKENKGMDLYYSLFTTRLGIFSGSHIGNVTDLWTAIQSKQPPDYIRDVAFTYRIGRPYQEVYHHLVKYKYWNQLENGGRQQLIVSGQFNHRMEYDQKRFASSSNAPQLDMQIATANAEWSWDLPMKGPWKSAWGVSAQYQVNRYSRRLFIPNYESTNLGIFWLQSYTAKNWSLEGGIRVDQKQIFRVSDNDELKSFPNLSFSNVSGNLSATQRLGQIARWTLVVSSAWRAPQVNELFADGLHHGAARIERGNATLNAERANNISSIFNLSKSKWELEWSAYAKWMDGFIFLEPTFPPELTIRGAFPSFRYTQTDARLIGTDISLTYHVNEHINWEGKASLLRARDLTRDQWIIQMPSDRYETRLEYHFRNAGKLNETYIGAGFLYVLRQIRVPLDGNIEIPGTSVKQSDYLMPPPSYWLTSIEAGTKLKVGHDNWSIVFTATNLFNRSYRDYMNAFRYFSDEIGRNLALRLRIPFDLKHSHKP